MAAIVANLKVLLSLLFFNRNHNHTRYSPLY